MKSRSIQLTLYLVLLGIISAHLYVTPIYSMDSIQYMGNALLMEENNAFHIHDRVYSELQRSVPKGDIERLLGHEPGASADQNRSLQERAANPSRFGEFLPLFAIRPLYNQTLYVVSNTGLGLVKAGILISVASYFALGVLLLLWLRVYMSSSLSALLSLLTMMSPPLTVLGRETTSDALSSVIAFAALYLIFEKRLLAAGVGMLLASLYFRTDFIVLAGPVILICWLQKKIFFWQATVLSVLAVGSVLCINHFAGDYGIKMLYYRNFVGTPLAPAEMHIQFSRGDYVAAFRSGISLVLAGFFLPFLLLGAIASRSKRVLPLLAATLGYVSLHFVILPNWQERWFGVYYLSMVVCAIWSGADVPDETYSNAFHPKA